MSQAMRERAIEAAARELCRIAGDSPDYPIHYEGQGDRRLKREPIRDEYLGTKRRDGSIIEQFPTVPLWRWKYEYPARAALAAAERVAGEDWTDTNLDNEAVEFAFRQVAHTAVSDNDLRCAIAAYLNASAALALSPGKVEGWLEERERCRGIVMARAALWNEHAKVGHEGDCSSRR